MDWNEEAIARLREMWAEGLSTAEIGRRLGVTKNAIVGKAHRLVLPPRPSPIRRNTDAGHVPRRSETRRAGGATLVDLDIGADAARPTPRPAAPRGPAMLRTVPAPLRPAVRVSTCCWPLGDPGTPSFRFCSDPAMTNKPYCEQHAALAYVKVRDRREDAA